MCLNVDAANHHNPAESGQRRTFLIPDSCSLPEKVRDTSSDGEVIFSNYQKLLFLLLSVTQQRTNEMEM